MMIGDSLVKVVELESALKQCKESFCFVLFCKGLGKGILRGKTVTRK